MSARSDRKIALARQQGRDDVWLSLLPSLVGACRDMGKQIAALDVESDPAALPVARAYRDATVAIADAISRAKGTHDV